MSSHSRDFVVHVNLILFEDGDYMLSLSRAGFNTLEERREQLTERFFRRSVLPETSCLHYLLPSKRNVSVVIVLLYLIVWTIMSKI